VARLGQTWRGRDCDSMSVVTHWCEQHHCVPDEFQVQVGQKRAGGNASNPTARIEAKIVTGVNENVRKRAEIVFLLSLTVVALYLCYLIARPFLGALLTAVMLAVVFYPVHSRVLRVFHRSTVAAALSTTLVCLVGVVPIAIVGMLVRDELRALVLSLREQDVLHTNLGRYFAHMGEILNRFDKYVDLSQLDPYASYPAVGGADQSVLVDHQRHRGGEFVLFCP